MNLRNQTDADSKALLIRENKDIKALLDVYPEEEVQRLLNNKDKLGKIVTAFQNVSAVVSTSSVVMTCNLNCPYKEVCILKLSDMAPIGYACPIEQKIVAELECDLVQSLEIKQDDPIEMEMLWDLIDMKLLDMRASGALKNGKLVQLVESKTGQNITVKEEIAPEVVIKLDLKKLKHSIIDSFVATRRAKKKYGMQNNADAIEELLRQAAKGEIN